MESLIAIICLGPFSIYMYLWGPMLGKVGSYREELSKKQFIINCSDQDMGSSESGIDFKISLRHINSIVKADKFLDTYYRKIWLLTVGQLPYVIMTAFICVISAIIFIYIDNNINEYSEIVYLYLIWPALPPIIAVSWALISFSKIKNDIEEITGKK